MHNISLDNDRLLIFLDRLLRKLDSVVDNEQRIIRTQDLVVKGNSIQVLLQERFEHLVVFYQGFFLFLDCQAIEQDFVVSFEEVVQVFELFVLFWGELLKLVLHLFGDLVLVYGALVER